jgi:hypothetical protein
MALARSVALIRQVADMRDIRGRSSGLRRILALLPGWCSPPMKLTLVPDTLRHEAPLTGTQAVNNVRQF